MMEKSIEDSRGKSAIMVKDFRPVFIGTVGRKDYRTSFITLAKDLEEDVCPIFIDGEIAQFIKDQQARLE